MEACLSLPHRQAPTNLEARSSEFRPRSVRNGRHSSSVGIAHRRRRAVSCRGMAMEDPQVSSAVEDVEQAAGRRYSVRLQGKLARLAKQILALDQPKTPGEQKEQQEKVRAFFQYAERQGVNWIAKDVQRTREAEQAKLWRNFHLRLQGTLKETPYDPEPGPDIPFSKFWKLLEEGKANFVEYSDCGEHMAVILPKFSDAKPREVPYEVISQDGMQIVRPKPTAYVRHQVQKMPGNAMDDVWRLLHPQLQHISIVRTNTILNHLYPPAKIVTVWALRFAAALVIHRLVSRFWAKFLNKEPKIRVVGTSADQVANLVLGALRESRARMLSGEESTGVTFDDFAGQDYIKREVQEIVKQLKESKVDTSVNIPKGILLHGPPGTGKTLLARAIAGESGLPFFSASGSEFVEMFAGVAASRVRDLFSRARSVAPSIIFVDEIDAIGARRGSYDVGGGGVEREQGLIQMLTELDGFATGLMTSRVLVIGATNRLDMLDPALLRRGRFDKILALGLPSEAGRLAILEVHARNKPFESEADKERLLRSIIKSTNHFSGAELANILNEAVILAARKDKDFIEKEELEEAILREGGFFATGQEDVLDVTGEAKFRLAYREAAVAVLACYYPDPDRPFIKTDVKTMGSKVNMKYEEPPEFQYKKKQDHVNNIVRTCAPRIVEEAIFGIDNTTWLSGKFLGQAAGLIDELVFRTGFTAFGRTYYNMDKDLLIHHTRKIQALRSEYLRYATQKCASVLLEYRSALETMADRLVEKSELEAAEIWEIFKKSPRIPQPEVFPVDEYGALLDTGRWGIHGLTLPGRATYHPGYVGYATFGTPKPMGIKPIKEEVIKQTKEKIRQIDTQYQEASKTKEGKLQWDVLFDYLNYKAGL